MADPARCTARHGDCMPCAGGVSQASNPASERQTHGGRRGHRAFQGATVRSGSTSPRLAQVRRREAEAPLLLLEDVLALLRVADEALARAERGQVA